MPAIRASFGPQMVQADGALDRASMRERLIADPDTKRRLEALLHPLIAQEALRQAQAARTPVVVFDVPLLAESASTWRPRVHRVAVVDCSPERQVNRVMARNGWPAGQAQAVMALQANRQARLALADDVIDNDSDDVSALAGAVTRLWAHWVNLGQAARAARARAE